MLIARRTMGIVILLISLVVLIWGIWPQDTLVLSSPIVIVFANLPITEALFRTSNAEISLKDGITSSTIYRSISISSPIPILGTSSNEPVPSHISENRLLVLEWQSRLRVGDTGYLRLTLALDRRVNSPIQNELGDNDLGNGTYQNQDSTAINNIIMEAHLDMQGVQYAPTGELSETLYPGQPVMFLWRVRAPKVGMYKGTIWLHLRLTPSEGGSESRSVLSAPRIEIQAVNFLGLGGATARILGSVGVVVGSMLGLDGIFSRLWDLFTRRIRSGNKS